MNCKHAREQLSAYLDGELDEQAKTAVEQHLSCCDACREELNGLRDTVDAMGKLPVIPAPGGLKEDVLARLPEKRRPLAAVRPWGIVKALAAAAVVVLTLRLADVPSTDEPLSITPDCTFGTRSLRESAKPSTERSKMKSRVTGERPGVTAKSNEYIAPALMGEVSTDRPRADTDAASGQPLTDDGAKKETEAAGTVIETEEKAATEPDETRGPIPMPPKPEKPQDSGNVQYGRKRLAEALDKSVEEMRENERPDRATDAPATAPAAPAEPAPEHDIQRRQRSAADREAPDAKAWAEAQKDDSHSLKRSTASLALQSTAGRQAAFTVKLASPSLTETATALKRILIDNNAQGSFDATDTKVEFFVTLSPDAIPTVLKNIKQMQELRLLSTKAEKPAKPLEKRGANAAGDAGGRSLRKDKPDQQKATVTLSRFILYKIPADENEPPAEAGKED